MQELIYKNSLILNYKQLMFIQIRNFICLKQIKKTIGMIRK